MGHDIISLSIGTILLIIVVFFGILPKWRGRRHYDTGKRRRADDTLERRVENLHALAIDLKRQAETDPLTSLWNRRGFLRLAGQEMRRALRYRKPFALLFIDIDNFKATNDTFGHAAGDLALQLVATEMGQQSRDGDVMARIGGDEFVLLLLETTTAGAAQVGERLCKGVESATTEANGTVFITRISVGIAQWNAEETIDQLLDRADKALYAAKAKEKGGYVVAENFGLNSEEKDNNSSDFDGDPIANN